VTSSSRGLRAVRSLATWPSWRERPGPCRGYLEMRDGGGCVHIFYDWRHDEPLIDLREVRRESSVHGESVAEQWPATSLRVVRGHKIACEIYHGTQGRWSKHSDDLAKLNEHLGVTP
jgi:hypothetical protein